MIFYGYFKGQFGKLYFQMVPKTNSLYLYILYSYANFHFTLKILVIHGCH